MSRGKILFQLTGSIAAFKACALISRLVQAGYEVQTVVTPHALEFIGPATLEGLTGRPVLADTFQKGHAMDHIHLARWADLTLLCPATAASLSRLAHGLADDLIGTLFLAHQFPEQASRYWIAPAMNSAMWRHPATATSVRTLQGWGIQILEPTAGALACGEIGEGRLIEPEDLFSKIESFFDKRTPRKSSRKKNILITAGGTREPIDAVRFISNASTGSTGATIADALVGAGCEVTFLHGIHSVLPKKSVKLLSFTDVASLSHALQTELSQNPYDAVIHAAAVGDFKTDSKSAKLSSNRSLQLKLVPTPKIIRSIKRWSQNPKLTLIGFKLTDRKGANAGLKNIFGAEGAPDYVVHNFIDEIDPSHHRSTLYDSKFKIVAKAKTNQQLAQVLGELL